MSRSLTVIIALLVPLATIGGAEEIRLVSDFDLSPDGSRIAFSWAGDVWSAALSDGRAAPLTRHDSSDSDPRYSPDGREIAFTSSRDGRNQVYVIPSDGGAAERITHHSESHALLQWLPHHDGMLVRTARDHFWTSSYRLFEVDRSQRARERLVVDAAADDARVSPDGRRVLVTREGTGTWRKGYVGSQASQIWLYERDEDRWLKLLHDELGARAPRWKPDGSGFWFVGRQSGSFELWEYDLATDERRRLTHHGDDSVLFPAVSRDGSTVVYRHRFDLWVLRLDSDAPARRLQLENPGEPVREEFLRRTLTEADQATFTDDGLEICFRAGGDLWVMDTELREPVRLTEAPGIERDPVFTTDGTAILFAGDLDGEIDIWRVERSDPDAYWWQNESFTVTRLTDDPGAESRLTRGPDGRVAFVHQGGNLIVMDEHGHDRVTVVEGWDAPSYDWSPDGQWLTYSRSDEDFNQDVWIAAIDGRRAPFNVSVHPDNDSSPVWSPNGRVLAFTGRRSDREVDVWFVRLRAEDEDEGKRDRLVAKALDKMKKARKAKKKGKEQPKEKVPEKAEKAEKSDPPSKPDQEKSGIEVTIDFDGLRDRIHRISTPNSSDRSLVWLDDETLAFYTSAGSSGAGLYTVKFPDALSPKRLTTSSVSGRTRLEKSKVIAGISSNRPAVMNRKGQVTTYAFSTRQEILNADRHEAAFVEGWRAMRDRFYDPRMNNLDWNAIRRKYQPMARAALDARQLGEVGNMMLGELNASHMGFSVFSGFSAPRSTSTESTAHLGVRFVEGFAGPGWLVRDVIPNGPAAEAKSRIDPGEVILSIDGSAVTPDSDPTALLNGDLARDVELKVRGVDDEVRTVVLRPTSYRNVRSNLYEAWLDHNQALVEERSSGSLGYLHIRGMSWSSFLKFEEELYEVGYGKDGLVIDVRKNGGGSTTDHLLTALTQPVHAITVPRGGSQGYPHDRKVYASWSKPVVVLCDQDSFSNAEIFAHAIKHLGRGQVVGVTTAGGVISTGSAGLLDRFGSVRMPFRGWFLSADGEDMELNGCAPHHVVWPWPGELPAGRDIQLETAVRVLCADVEAWRAQQRPRTRTAAEKRAE